MGHRTYPGFVQVMENLKSHGILWFHFPGLESHGIWVLVVESDGKWCWLYKITNLLGRFSSKLTQRWQIFWKFSDFGQGNFKKSWKMPWKVMKFQKLQRVRTLLSPFPEVLPICGHMGIWHMGFEVLVWVSFLLLSLFPWSFWRFRHRKMVSVYALYINKPLQHIPIQNFRGYTPPPQQRFIGAIFFILPGVVLKAVRQQIRQKGNLLSYGCVKI